MSESIELQVNLNTLVQAGWCVEMETGLRGGQIRSWVKLRHFEHAKTHKIRAAPLGLSAAIKVAMVDVGLAPFEHSPAPTHETSTVLPCGCDIARTAKWIRRECGCLPPDRDLRGDPTDI